MQFTKALLTSVVVATQLPDESIVMTDSFEGIPRAVARYGLDISTTLSVSAADCFKNYGYDWIAPRAYESIGAVDTQVCTSLKNADTAGFSLRDAYMFPCPTCSKSAATQVSEAISHLNGCGTGVWSKWLWLDIEAASLWKGSSTANRSWYQQLVDACNSHAGVTCGIYGSYYQWEDIFGSAGYCYGSNLPLWYAHWDNSISFNDYSNLEFGCWKTPYAKQYVGDTTLCGMGIDKDYVRP